MATLRSISAVSIYDGIWVGENSKIPNVAGIRKALIDAFVKIKA